MTSFFNMSLVRARFRNWCFTINNFDEVEEACVIDLEEDEEVSRCIAEHEHLFEGTPHIQGYVSFFEPKSGEYLKALISRRAHVEPAKGGWKQNARYCSKEGFIICSKNCDPDNDGVASGSGRVTEDVLRAAKTMDPWHFEDTFPLIWFHHRAKILNVMMDAALRRVEHAWDGDLKKKNLWLWGRPGIGKSQWANTQLNPLWMYKKSINKWWDGYNLVVHKEVILEDFPQNGQMFAQHLKIWGDRYHFMAECKGSSLTVEPGRFFLIVTSNYCIDSCFEPEDASAIKRRFTEFWVTEESITLLRASRLDLSILKS